MRNVDHAVDVLKEMIGLPTLGFEDGAFELRFDGTVTVAFVRASESEIELSAVLTNIGDDLPREGLAALLAANLNGEGTGPGRLALDPRGGRPVYCGRLDVTRLEAYEFERAILAFLKYVLYWEGPGAEAIAAVRPGSEEAALGPEDVGGADDFTFIRL